MFKKDRVIIYTMEEFLDKDKRSEVERNHKKKVLKKYLKMAGTTTTAIASAVVVIGGAKYMVAYVPIKAATSTLVACTSSAPVVINNMDAFNEFVAHALNKLYATTCLGGLAVESLQGGNRSKQKFGACINKYTICYGGGLFVLYALAEMKNLAL